MNGLWIDLQMQRIWMWEGEGKIIVFFRLNNIWAMRLPGGFLPSPVPCPSAVLVAFTTKSTPPLSHLPFPATPPPPPHLCASRCSPRQHQTLIPRAPPRAPRSTQRRAAEATRRWLRSRARWASAHGGAFAREAVGPYPIPGVKGGAAVAGVRGR
jgi:hypothetical protein